MMETYYVNGVPIIVQRDDLSFPAPAPPFSKCRGILRFLKNIKNSGITVIGYTETSISMAGWGVAWAAQELGMTCVIFDPQYKSTPPLLEHHRKQWARFGAIIVPIKAGMAKVNWYISKRYMAANHPNSLHLPLGLPLTETIQATSMEVKEVLAMMPIIPRSIVINVGSGTMTAGVLMGVEETRHPITVFGVLGRKTKDLAQKKKNIILKSGIGTGMFAGNVDLELIDPGWEYTQKSTIYCPFPSHPYYDLKAWEWLVKNIKAIPNPVLFWNIGSQPPLFEK